VAKVKIGGEEIASFDGRRRTRRGSTGGMVIAILTILVVYVTMVYGPIAAMLVELFPTRIRYTSMSLPYHIGNGWLTFVIGTLFIRDDQGPPHRRLVSRAARQQSPLRRAFFF
jgi:hypothetical protein